MSETTPSTHDRPWLRFYAEGIAADLGDPTDESIGDMVRRAARLHGDRPAFSNLGGTLSFTDIERLSDRFAKNLVALGLEPGERIALQMPNLLQYPVAIFGALKAGLAVVNINPLYTEAEIRRVVEDAKPRAFVVLGMFADKLERVLPGSSIEHVILTRPGDLLPGPRRTLVNFVARRIKRMEPPFSLPNAIPYRHMVAEPTGHPQLPTPHADDIAFLQYTGGTTGGPKAAVLTHRNLLANQEQIVGLIGTAFHEPNPVVIAALPMYHVFSLTVNCFGLFMFGAETVLITNPRDLDDFVATLRKTRPNGIILVSSLAGGLLENEGFRGLDFSRLEIALAGGMAVRTAVADRWKEVTGIPILEGYGLTETSPVVSVNPPHLPPRLGTIGIPLPSTEVEIRDEDGNRLPTGEAGELVVRGPQVMREYWNRPDATAEIFADGGWLRTGDIATIDEDGYLTIVDRKKEMIVVSGFNVYPSEIEDAAMLHPGVLEAGCIGIPNEHSGEVPKLFVVRRDASLTEDEVRAHLKTQLTGYKRPREIVFRDELPKSNVGKVLRKDLKDL